MSKLVRNFSIGGVVLVIAIMAFNIGTICGIIYFGCWALKHFGIIGG
jgi:hypothetical protein